MFHFECRDNVSNEVSTGSIIISKPSIINPRNPVGLFIPRGIRTSSACCSPSSESVFDESENVRLIRADKICLGRQIRLVVKVSRYGRLRSMKYASVESSIISKRIIKDYFWLILILQYSNLVKKRNCTLFRICEVKLSPSTGPR